MDMILLIAEWIAAAHLNPMELRRFSSTPFTRLLGFIDCFLRDQ